MRILLVFLLLIGISFENAFAQFDTKSIDATCNNTLNVVLPFIGRPKGKELPPRRAVFSERLVQEISCAWMDLSLEEKIVHLVEQTRGSGEQNKLIADLTKLVDQERARIQADSLKKMEKSEDTSNMRLRIFGGFYEEFYGNIAFTFIEFLEDRSPLVIKITVSEVAQANAIEQISELVGAKSNEFLDRFVFTKHERLPVFVTPVDALDDTQASENLAKEMDLFIRSRLDIMLRTHFFQRKNFFRFELDQQKSKYKVEVKIRRDSIKFYGSITVVSLEDGRRRTGWVEEDITRLPQFEEEVLETSLSNLQRLEEIHDYSLVGGFDILAHTDNTVRSLNISLRQNLGNASFSMRLRTGGWKMNPEDPDLTLYMMGWAAGWQFADFRWIAADAGLGLDVGVLGTSFSALTQQQSLLLSYGPYIQGMVIFTRNLSVIGRAGVEQFQKVDATKEQQLTKPPPYFLNLSIGVGLAF